MASQAQINEQKWQEYEAKFTKAGLFPPENVRRGYLQQRDYWNTWDPDATDAFNQQVLRKRG